MYKINIKEILKKADEMGIKYILNSKNPGFYIIDKNGKQRKTTVEELLFLPPLT